MLKKKKSPTRKRNGTLVIYHPSGRTKTIKNPRVSE